MGVSVTFPNGQTLTTTALTETTISQVFQILICQILGLLVNTPYTANLEINNNIAVFPSVANLTTGFVVVDTNLPTGTTITAINGNNVTLSNEATATAANEIVLVTNPASNSAVRLAWQTQGDPAWAITDNIVFIEAVEKESNYSKIRDQATADNEDGLTATVTLQYSRVWTIRLSSRGPGGFDACRIIKSALLLDWTHDSLALSNLYVNPSFSATVRIPELKSGRWWARLDFNFDVYEGIIETIVYNTIGSVQIQVNNNNGQLDNFVVTEGA